MTLAELLGLAQKAPPPVADEGFDPDRPWESAALRRPDLAPVPAAPASSGYAYSQPDPMADAQALAEKRQALGQLSSPMSPILEVPADLWALLLKIAGQKQKK
jgi:hypothetical protein